MNPSAASTVTSLSSPSGELLSPNETKMTCDQFESYRLAGGSLTQTEPEKSESAFVGFTFGGNPSEPSRKRNKH